MRPRSWLAAERTQRQIPGAFGGANFFGKVAAGSGEAVREIKVEDGKAGKGGALLFPFDEDAGRNAVVWEFAVGALFVETDEGGERP